MTNPDTDWTIDEMKAWTYAEAAALNEEEEEEAKNFLPPRA